MQDKELWTALHLAAKIGQFETCELLLHQRELSINEKNSHRLNAFAYFVQNKPTAAEEPLYCRLLLLFVQLGSNLSVKYNLLDPRSTIHHRHPRCNP